MFQFLDPLSIILLIPGARVDSGWVDSGHLGPCTSGLVTCPDTPGCIILLLCPDSYVLG